MLSLNGAVQREKRITPLNKPVEAINLLRQQLEEFCGLYI